MPRRWLIEEIDWTEDFRWFLVDEGVIWYAFTSRPEAEQFRAEHWPSGMLLLDVEGVLYVLMAEPGDIFCWRNKRQTCVVLRDP